MAKNKLKVLVIDDDPKVSWLLSEGLSKKFEFGQNACGAPSANDFVA